MNNGFPLESYCLQGALETRINAFVDNCNLQRYHENINKLTPADVYFGRTQSIMEQREGSNATPSANDDCNP